MGRVTFDRTVLHEGHQEALRVLPLFGELILASPRGMKGGRVFSRMIGSSLEFSDHRPYAPGDDVRTLDWRASARTRQPLVRTFHEELLPLVDVLFDVSASMCFERSKCARVCELLYFIFEMCKQEGASIRIWAVGSTVHQISHEELESHFLTTVASAEIDAANSIPSFQEAPLRTGSLRILLSDLLYPVAPAGIARHLGAYSIILAPRCHAEANPDWRGNVVLVDCESGARRRCAVNDAVLRDYLDAYERHFSHWSNEVRRIAGTLYFIDSECPLEEALLPLIVGQRPALGM